MKSDLNLLGYAVFSSKPLPEWKNAYYVPMRVPKTTHYSFFILGEPGEDVCFASVLPALKKRNQRTVIWIFTDSVGEEIFKNNPYVDRIFVIPVEEWRKTIWDKAQEAMYSWIQTHRQGVGWVCNLSGSPLCALLARLVGGTKAFGLLMDDDGAPIIQGNRWMQYAIEVLYPEISDGVLCDENIMGKREMLALALGLDPEEKGNGIFIRQYFSDQDALLEVEPFVAFCPSVSQETRKWKMEYWEDLLEFVRKEYGLNVVLVNFSLTREPLAPGLVEKASLVVDTSRIDEAAYVLARSRLLVSVDNGVVQLASSLGIPTLSICGPRNRGPDFEGLHLSVRKDVPCAPCNLRTCSRRYCLDHLTPEVVKGIFRFYWDSVRSGEWRDLEGFKRYCYDMNLVAEVYDEKLPSIMHRYARVTDNYTEEVISKVSRLAYLYVWNYSNKVFVGEDLDVDFSRYVDWALEKNVEWNVFESAIKSQIRGLKEWEQRLSLLIVRLSELFPSFPFSIFRRSLVDPENLWDSLLNFDSGLPIILKKLLYEEWDAEMGYKERIKEWLRVKRRLLDLIKEYRSFLEQFLFSRTSPKSAGLRS